MPSGPTDVDSSFLTKKIGPLPFWAWAGILFVGVYVYRKYQANAAGTLTATTTASTGVAPPTETLTTAGGTYSGPVNAAPSSITDPTAAAAGTAPGTGATSPGNGGGTPGQTAATVTTVPSALPSLFNIGGQSYEQIGTITGAGGSYYGSQVSGGAPVYFGSPAGVSQLSGPAAIEQQPVGTNAYVLAQNAGNVSPNQGAAKF